MLARRPRASGLALSLLALAACGGAPQLPAKIGDPDPTPPPSPVPAPLAARWVESGGATLVGPEVPGGTLLLLGGRRAVLRADGSLEAEKVPSPEPIDELVEVPVNGARRLVGRGAHGVYRFDDPLGAPVVVARSDDPLARIGAAPGAIAVWRGASDPPRFLDAESGADKPIAGLPLPPLHAIAFADEKRGAAVFEAVGLAVTSDGGATWRTVAGPSTREALRTRGIRVRRGELRAYTYADGPEGAIDTDRARLGLFAIETPAKQAPIARWIRDTGRDPLEAIASGGLDLPDGRALVASHGLLARAEPRTGAIDALIDLAGGKGSGTCGAGRSAETAWIACSLAQEGRDLFDPFGVVRVPLGEGPLAPASPDLVRNGEAELRVSPSGGAMLLAPCKGEELGSACVRQPDGKWKTIVVDGELAERGAGPLADGRVAFLRGLFDGDDASRAGPQPVTRVSPSGKNLDAEDEAPKGLHLAAVGLDKVERSIASVTIGVSRGYVRSQSPLEEDADRTLRLVVEDGEGPYAVVSAPGKDAAQTYRIPDAAAARLHAGRGIAAGEGRVLASLDGGATWAEVPAPPAALDAARMAADAQAEPGMLAVSDVGAKVGAMLRLGWGPAETEASDTRPAAKAPPLAWGPGPPSPPPGLLKCASQGPAHGTPPVDRYADMRALLERDAPKKRPGTRRESAISTWSRAGMLDAIALFEEDGPEDSASGRGGGAVFDLTNLPRHPTDAERRAPSGPAKWTVRWFDPREIGGRVRSAVIPVPKDVAWGTSLRFVGASGGRALFALRTAGKLRLVRVKASGGVDVADVGGDAVPVGEAVFGDGRSNAVAWVREALVFVWLPGERPRAIALLAGHATLALGAPTTEGVPILLSSSSFALARTLAIPKVDKGSPADPAPVPPTLDGWSSLPPLPSRLDALPACTGKGGTRFALSRVDLRAELDGVSQRAQQAIYDVRLDGGKACVAGVAASLAAKPPVAKGKAPAGFLRVDLLGKRAEGGERGLAPALIVRMRCALGAGSSPGP